MSQFRIAHIDDSAFELMGFHAELELHGLSVSKFDSVAQCDELFGESPPEFDLFIVDIMMPPGRRYAQMPTNEGLLTGLFLARDLRELFPETPIIFLTAAWNPVVIKSTSTLTKNLSNCLVIHKPMLIDASEIAAAMKTAAESANVDAAKPKGKGWGTRVFQSLLLQPNIAGVGVDLKKLP